MNKERILHLADFLDKVLPPEKFDMDIIMDAPFDSPPSLTSECGAAGCAIGWSPFAFPDLLEHRGLDVYLKNKADCLDVYEKSKAPCRNFDAIQKVLDISEDQAEYLFDTTGWVATFISKQNISPQMVADKLREFVNTDGTMSGHFEKWAFEQGIDDDSDDESEE